MAELGVVIVDRRARFVLRVGLVSVLVGWLVALVLVSRTTAPGRSWAAWLPLQDTPVRLLSCQLVDEGERAWYSSSAGGLTAVPVAVLAVALVASLALPRLARLLSRLAVAIFVLELGVLAGSWLEKAVVGRVGLDQDPSCGDALQIGQAVSRGAYLDMTMLLGISLSLLAVLEVDVTLSSSNHPRRQPPRSGREVAVAWVLRALLLASAGCAFGRALYVAPSPALVLEVGGLMLLTTVTAFPVALAERPSLRALGWVSWTVGLGLAVTSWCATWAVGFDHERSEQGAPGVQTFRTFSDLGDDQLGRLDGFQHFFAWWFLGLVAMGLLGIAVTGLRRRRSTAQPVDDRDVRSIEATEPDSDRREQTTTSS